jgi:hypothetical protein
MSKSAAFLDLKWKLRGHIAMLVLVLLLLILTGVYMNLAPFVTRPDIMGIVYVSVIDSPCFVELVTRMPIDTSPGPLY